MLSDNNYMIITSNAEQQHDDDAEKIIKIETKKIFSKDLRGFWGDFWFHILNCS